LTNLVNLLTKSAFFLAAPSGLAFDYLL